MKLTRVELEGAGRFGVKTRLEGLGAGINILAAQNEAGKSTFFRAIRTCLFERHGARNEQVAALATEGLSLPVTVTLGLEHEGASYEIAKTFLKSPSARLMRNGIEIARDRAADEELWELLGIAPGSGRSVDDAAFGILWVSQGHSFSVPEPSAAAASALNAAIQQEVGTLVGGERARGVLAQLAASLGKSLTETGRPKKGSGLDDATRQVEVFGKELAQAEQQLVELDASLDKLVGLRQQHKQLADPAEAARLQKDLEETDRQLKSAEDSAALLRRHEEDARAAESLLKAQQEKRDGLLERCRKIEAGRSRQAELNHDLADLAAQEGDSRRSYADEDAALKAADSAIVVLDGKDQQLRRLSAFMQQQSTREGLASRLNALQSYATRATENSAALAANRVDAEAIAALNACEQEQAAMAARLEAASTQIAVQRIGEGRLTVDGEEVATGLSRAITAPLTIIAGDTARITLLPPQASIEAAKSQTGKLQQKLQQLLAAHGASTPAELRTLHHDRLALDAEARGLKDIQAALGLKSASPVAEIPKLASDIAKIDAEHKRILAETGTDELPTADQIAAAQAESAAKLATLRAERARCEAAANAQRDTLARLSAAQAEIRGQLSVIASELAADLGVLPDDRRAEILSAADADLAAKVEDHRQKADVLVTARAAAPGPDAIERLRNRSSRLHEAVTNRNRTIIAVSEAIARLEGQIEIAGGDGLGERVADLRARKEMAEAELERQTERVATLQLLHQVVKASYEKRREELNAPLRRHLKPFLNDVFPQSDIDLGDGFAVTGLRRSGSGSEQFGRLSAGTQEQIAILVRLAMGAMLAERSNEVPIILDDALVFSDDTRIEQMFDALNRAGKSQQVIVFTCRARSFASLGGRQLHIEQPSAAR